MAEGFGKYEIYAIAESVYCYPDCGTLRNKFGIRDAGKLRKVEADISAIRQTDLLTNPVTGRFSPSHLCHIHSCLLGDIYSFAGHFRREDIAKGDTRFLSYKEIKEKLTTLLRLLHEENLLAGLSFDQFVERSSYYFSKLNYIHPFREGNGRATREFMRQLFDRNGYDVNWGRVDTRTLMDAMAESVFDTQLLADVLRTCLIQS